MSQDNFLQKFHDLGSADEEKRCRAARGMKEALLSDRLGNEDLSYTIRRLVRGVQSSRQCCRQGFCVALAEVLQAFPGELATVLKLVDQTAELQSGLKATEQKERLLGRLLVYAAVLQAGSLRRAAPSEGGNGHGPLASDVVQKLGRGLLQVYNARPYMAPVAVSILADTCSDLCLGGHYSQVPEVVSEWHLDQKVGDGEGLTSLDGHVCGLVIGLRTAYEDTICKGVAPSSLKSWPSCVRKDVLQGDVLPKVAKNLGKALAGLPVGDPVPPMLSAFCSWWVRPYKGRDPVALQEHIWPALEEGLFSDHRSPAALAQGFRGMAELATHLRSASEEAKVDEILAGFFQQLQTGWRLLLSTVAWNKAPAYQSAVHAHGRLVAIVGGREAGPPVQSKANQKKGGQKNKPDDSAQRQDPDLPPPACLRDETRLTMLEALQNRQEFQKVPGNLQRQWQQALLAPLSPLGVRSRCGTLIASIAKGKGPATRVAVAQLEHLALHSKAPDEVVLAVVFLLFTTAYFGPSAEGSSGLYSLRSFKEAAGLPSMPPEVDDVAVPVVKIAEDERESWRAKVWSALAQLSRRTLPEAAERLVSGQAELSANEAFSGGEEGPGSLVRSLAYQGCLGDGSYLVLRLHQWWDHILSQAPAAVSSPTAKKKKKAAEAGCLQCLVDLKEDEVTLRNRAVASCRAITELPEGRGGLSARQKNAICSLPLSLSLTLIEESMAGRDAVKETLGELLEILEEIERVAKTTNKTKKKLAENLAAIAPVAAELFVQDSPALVREAARLAWRELGYFSSDDTLTSLCGSVCQSQENEPEEGEEDEDDEDEPLTAAGASRKAAFDNAISALKEGEGREDNEDDEDLTTLDSAGVLTQLLGGDENSDLLESFAASGLEGADNTKKKTLTQRQKRIRRKQEDAVRRLREVDLLELFLMKHGAKRTVSLDLVQELFSAMVRLIHKAKASPSQEAAGDKGEGDQGKGKQKNRKKMQSKADSELRQLEENLGQRIHKLLQKLLKLICRAGVVQTLASWHSPEEWAKRAKAMQAQGQTPKVCMNGPRPLEVGSALFYFFCAAHQAASANEEETQDTPGGWALAEELLGALLQEWGGKKDSDNWSQAALKAFSVRMPQLLQKLPWAEAIRNSRKAYTQRMQIAFVANSVLRPPLPGSKQEEVAALLSFADSFAGLCAELLSSTLAAASEEGGASANQTNKLRREALQAVKSALRIRQKSGDATKTIPPNVAASVANAVAGLRDSLPVQRRQGEVYQLCVYILRIVRPQVSNQSSKRQQQSQGDRQSKKQKVSSELSGEDASSKPAASPREKKRRGRGRSASQSPSAKPAASPSLAPKSPTLKAKRPRSRS